MIPPLAPGLEPGEHLFAGGGRERPGAAPGATVEAGLPQDQALLGLHQSQKGGKEPGGPG